MSTLPVDSRKRLTTLEQYSDLGSGFQIAMRDLDIRGAGNLLRGEQSGFIAEIGFEMYHKILDEAVRELKRKEFKDLFKEEIQQQDDFVSDCSIDTDLEILIPDDYVESITERLTLYSRLDNCESEQDLAEFHAEMHDRFGPVPPQVEDLFTTVRCRKLAVELGLRSWYCAMKPCAVTLSATLIHLISKVPCSTASCSSFKPEPTKQNSNKWGKMACW